MILLYNFFSSLASIFIECGYLSIKAGFVSGPCFFLKGQLGLFSMVVKINEDLRQGFLTIFDAATLHDIVTLPLF